MKLRLAAAAVTALLLASACNNPDYIEIKPQSLILRHKKDDL